VAADIACIDYMNTVLSIGGYVMMAGGMAGLALAGVVVSANPLVLALQTTAVALMIWARLVFGRRSFHAAAQPTGGRLVTRGPYRFVRHPIYESVCLFAWACGLGHLSVIALGMAAIVTVGAVVRVAVEERLLRQQYPEYVEYARRTKRIVPYVF
jgi:protein-S-isoprenylcysteine O-methyltransferase Ste14